MINYGDGLHPALDTITRITPTMRGARTMGTVDLTVFLA
jgi:hypothetical protein